MVHNKIIFLDVDGVINIPNYEKFDANCLESLRQIIKHTRAKVVVSSSWRSGSLATTKQSLVDGGFPDDLLEYIIGETIRGYHETIEGSFMKVVRGNEIGTWVDRNLKYPWHGNPDMYDQYATFNEDGSFKMMNSNKVGVDYSYVILDDDNDMLLCQSKFFVHTDGIKGLTIEDMKKAISILNQIDLKTMNQHANYQFHERRRTNND